MFLEMGIDSSLIGVQKESPQTSLLQVQKGAIVDLKMPIMNLKEFAIVKDFSSLLFTDLRAISPSWLYSAVFAFGYPLTSIYLSKSHISMTSFDINNIFLALSTSFCNATASAVGGVTEW
jgi:hypothetical protein